MALSTRPDARYRHWPFHCSRRAGAKRGQKWHITMKHNGKTIYDKTRTVDRDGEIEVEKWRKNAKGVDTFVTTAKRVGGSGYCKVTLSR